MLFLLTVVGFLVTFVSLWHLASSDGIRASLKHRCRCFLPFTWEVYSTLFYSALACPSLVWSGLV